MAFPIGSRVAAKALIHICYLKTMRLYSRSLIPDDHFGITLMLLSANGVVPQLEHVDGRVCD